MVDTIAPGGMMTLGAIFVAATRDTLVVQANGRTRIATVVAGPQVLAQAAWLANRQPITLTTTAGRARYLRTGEPRVLASGKFILLGMMRNVPLFAAATEGAAMRPEVEALAARGVDLEKALSQRVSLRRQMDRVKTLYVPTALVGCTFQPFTREQRRR